MKYILPNKESQSGQVVLITLMVLAVVLSIGLSIISRSITDVKTSQQSQESARAFWVAQGELDKAIRASSGLNASVGNINNVVTRSEMGGAETFVYPESIIADHPATIWFVGHNTDGSINASSVVRPNTFTLYWGNNSTIKTAVEVTFTYFDGTSDTYKLVRYAYDPDSSSGSNFNNSVGDGGSVGGGNFVYRSPVIDITGLTGGLNKIYFARVKFMGNTEADTLAVKIDSGKNFPSQGSCYESTSVVEASGISRKLTSCQLWHVYPAIFDNALFSGTTI